MKTYTVPEHKWKQIQESVEEAMNLLDAVYVDITKINQGVVFEPPITTADAEPVPQPPAEQPAPVVYQGPDFGPPDDDGAQRWGFLAGLYSPAAPVPMKVIANFAKLNYAFNEAQARSHEMNVGGAGQQHNIAYRIIESSGWWDRRFGKVTWRNGDVLQGVIAFPPNVTIEEAKQMLRGRVKRMERETNSRHWKWLDSKDLKAGA